MKEFKPNYDEGMWKGAPKSSFLKAKELRRNETEAEKLLWDKLKGNQINGLKFRRQHPIQLFIADFYCHQIKLIIEIDGEYHLTKEQIIKDRERTEILNEMGIEVIRFKNDEVTNRIDLILSQIKIKIEKLKIQISPNLKGVEFSIFRRDCRFVKTLRAFSSL